MRCDSCGVEIPQEQRFCVHCGAPRPVATKPKEGSSKPPMQTPDSEAGAGTSWSRILVLLVFLLLLLALFYLVPGVR